MTTSQVDELGTINSLIHLCRYSEEALSKAVNLLPAGQEKIELVLSLANVRVARARTLVDFDQYVTAAMDTIMEKK